MNNRISGSYLVMLHALLGAIGCVPPSVEDLSGGEVPALIGVDLGRVTPQGDVVSLIRRPENFLVFDVREAFQQSTSDSDPLFFYWYVDWDTDNLVAPVEEQTDSFQFFACSETYDLPRLNGTYPERRSIMVLATLQPLENPEQGYLEVTADVPLAVIDWTLSFEGQGSCIGDRL